MFTHLHVHTEYSLQDGLSRIEPLVRRATELGMESLALTDHGGLYGAIDFYRAARDGGIKPIIGCEMYVAPGSRHSKAPGEKGPYHLTVLARDIKGYGNLVKLVTAAHLEGFYYKPRVDRELLERHHEGLLVLSGCPSGEVPELITQGRMDEAKAAAGWYKDLFGGYYLELMEHGGIDELPAINRGLLELHKDLDIPVVATNDSHYVHREDAPLQDILVCIHTNTNIQDERRLKMTEDSYYLKSPQEMAALYPELPEAITNTQRIAEMCDLELDFSQVHLPRFKVPDGLTADEYLKHLCEEGLKRRIEPIREEETDRLAYELEVIRQTRYADYFLVVWDIARFVRDNDIYFAVRGSAAGSLVLFCLGATDINPLQYGIVFDRFLNVGRKELPDIDMDFQDDRREEVLNYIVEKYGRDNVAQIITFGTLGARASIRDTGRALAMPYAEVDRIARLIPPRLNMTLETALEESPELAEVYGADESMRKLVDTARSLEGITRHSSTHAAGVVISEEPLDAYVPLQRPAKGDDESISVTQYSMEPLASLGLLKMDFLGLANLTILSKARDLVAQTKGVRLNHRDIPLDDEKTFELLSRGDTAGVFQLEGSGMTRYIKELKPNSLMDVAAMIALYRPGPMEQIATFIEAKHGLTEAQYPHPALKEILEETYGVIVYQDQVFYIAQIFAGYSLAEADILRKAMGKKIPEIMAQERQKFVQGALDQGYSQELVEEVFALVEPFAGYGFPKAHAVSYGLISYWTAYFKANYPEEYMVCLLSTFADNTDKVAGSVAECRRLKIPVLPPDVSSSDTDFSVEPQAEGPAAVRFGLAAIKNVGAAAVRPIVEARKKDGPFESLEHMCRAADLSALNRKTLESLIKAGALDSFGMQGGLLQSVDRVLALAQSETHLRQSNQTSMFDLFGESVPTPLSHIAIPEIEPPDSERLSWERELLGVDLSGANQRITLAADADSGAIVSRSQVTAEMNGQSIALLGQVERSTERVTRTNRPYVIASLALLDGEIDVFIWEDRLEETRDLWEVGTLVSVAGTVRDRGDQISISCTGASRYEVGDQDGEATEKVEAPDTSGYSVTPSVQESSRRDAGAAQVVSETSATDGDDPSSRRLRLRIRESGQSGDDQRLLEEVSSLLLENRGDDEVSLEIAVDGHIVTLEWPLARVSISPSLEVEMRRLLGSAGSVTVEEARG